MRACLISAARSDARHFGALVQALRNSLVLGWIIAACTHAIAQSVPEPARELQTMTGIVVNQVTRQPISRALVFSSDNRLAVLTDEEGHFSFSVIKQAENEQGNSGVFFGPRNFIQFGTIALSARKPGFLQDPEGFQTPTISPLVIALMPEAVIQGRVLSGTSEPAANMTVQLFRREVQEGSPHWLTSSATQTNSSGEYRFAELPPGEYKVMTQELLDTDPETSRPGSQVYGFPPACFPGVPDFASGTTITLSVGQRFHGDIFLKRQPYYRVAIPVLNMDSGGLNINVSAQAHPGPGYSLGYNSSTHRIEGLLPSGTYLVQAIGFAPPASGEVTFTISGHEVTSPNMVVTPSAVIPIEVHEEFIQEWNNQTNWSNGKRTFELHGPRAYLQMWLEPVDDFSQLGRPSLRPPVSRPDEPLVLENVLPGAYWVRFHTNRGYVQSISSNGTDLLHHPLVVSGSPASIDVSMRDDTAQLSGTVAGVKTFANTVSNVSSRATAYVYCIPQPDSTGAYQEIFSMADGNFVSGPVDPGTYRVLAFARPKHNLPYHDAAAMRAYENQGQVVTLVAGQTEHLQLQLSPGD